MKETIVFCGDPHGHFYLPEKNEKVFILGDLFNHSAFNAKKLKIITSFYPPSKKDNYYFLAGNHDVHRTVEGTDIISCLGYYFSLNYPVFKNLSTALIPCFNRKFFIKVLCLPYYLPQEVKKDDIIKILLDPDLDIDIVAMHKTIDFEDPVSFPFYTQELIDIMKENKKIKYIFLGHMHTPTKGSITIPIDNGKRQIIFAQSLIPTKYNERGDRFVFKVHVDENKNFSLEVQKYPTKKYIICSEETILSPFGIKNLLEKLKEETVIRPKPKLLTEDEYPSKLTPALIIEIYNPENENEVRIKVSQYFENYEVMLINKFADQIQEKIVNNEFQDSLDKDRFINFIKDDFLKEIIKCDPTEFIEKKNIFEKKIIERLESLCLEE